MHSQISSSSGFRERYEENETLLVLQEPNVMEEYEEWKEWMDQAALIKKRLDSVLEAISREKYTHRPVDLLYVLGQE